MRGVETNGLIAIFSPLISPADFELDGDDWSDDEDNVQPSAAAAAASSQQQPHHAPASANDWQRRALAAEDEVQRLLQELRIRTLENIGGDDMVAQLR